MLQLESQQTPGSEKKKETRLLRLPFLARATGLRCVKQKRRQAVEAVQTAAGGSVDARTPGARGTAAAFICAMRSSRSPPRQPPATSTAWLLPRNGSWLSAERNPQTAIKMWKRSPKSEIPVTNKLAAVCFFHFEVLGGFRERHLPTLPPTFPLVSSPATRSWPLGAIFCPATSCISVDFPAPLSPTAKHRAPVGSAKSRPAREKGRSSASGYLRLCS